jgi:hypothetical protein
MDHIVEATVSKGEDYSLLEEAYKELVGRRARWLNAVAKQVGGVVETRSLGGRGSESFTKVPEEKQRAAVKFINDNAFSTSANAKLTNPAVINLFRYSGVASEVASQQRGLLNTMLSPSVIGRLLDGETQSGEKAYTPSELVADLQAGIFSELKAAEPKVDPLRRQLQRNFVETLAREFTTPADSGISIPAGPPSRRNSGSAPAGRNSELRAVARVSLESLAKEIAGASSKAKDPITVAHLKDLKAEIDNILNPKKGD